MNPSPYTVGDWTIDCTLQEPTRSDWQCQLFGGNGDGIVYTPLKGQVPNWFWRKMQYLCFGHKWIKA